MDGWEQVKLFENVALKFRHGNNDLPSVTWGCAQLAGKTKGDDEKKVVLSDSPGNQSEGRIYEVKHAQKERGRVLKVPRDESQCQNLPLLGTSETNW